MGLIKRGKAWNRAQAGSQWSSRQVFVLISVMVLAFVLYAVGAGAAQVGSATITDAGGINQGVVDSGGNLHGTGQVGVDSSTPSPRAGPECTIIGTTGDDRLRGTPRDDVICALAGDDGVKGWGGNDTLILGPGNDFAKGGRAGKDDDVIRGGAGDDFLGGGPGNDRVYGQGGSEAMLDWHGVDLLSGGAGDDWCMNVGDGEGGDVIRGGRGRDKFWADGGDRVFSVERRVLSCG
jgi:Ca2+-binding RTX toxin-like protein